MSDESELEFQENGVPPKEYNGEPPEEMEHIEVFGKGSRIAVVVVRCTPTDIMMRRCWTSDSQDHPLAEQLVRIIRTRFGKQDKNLFLVAPVSETALAASLQGQDISGTYMEKGIDKNSSSERVKHRDFKSTQEYDDWFKNEVQRYATALDTASGKASDPVFAMQRATNAMNRVLPQGQQTEGQFFLVLVDEEDKRVGTIWFGIKPNTQTTFLYNVEIEEAYRGKGHGHQILKLWQQIASEKGARKLSLHVFEYNAIAKALYLKSGFKVMATNFQLR